MPTRGGFSHDDPGYKRRKAWERAKQAFGECEVVEMLTRLERSPDGSPRILLAACIHYFLTQNASGRAAVVDVYLRSLAFPTAESIPLSDLSSDERASLETDFRQAMLMAGFVEELAGLG